MAEAHEALQNVMKGAMAYGWPYNGAGPVDLNAEPLRGWLRLHEDGYLEYEALVDEPDGPVGLGRPSAPTPTALFLSTRHGALLLPQLFPRVAWQHNYGGDRASVDLYRSDAALFGAESDDISSNRFKRLAMRFFGMGPWAEMNLTEINVTHEPGGRRVREAQLRLRSAAPQHIAGKMPSSLSLTLEGDWVLGSEYDGRRDVSTALRVVLEAKRPRPVSDLVVVLGDIQDLLAILRGGLTYPVPSNIATRTDQGPQLFWSADLMLPSPRSIAAPERENLKLSLAQIGGVQGLANWCRLAEEHRDIVYALSSFYREGPSTIDMALIRLGVAIELWVARHSKTRWGTTRGRMQGWTYAHSMAHHLGPVFAEFVGDVDLWAGRLTHAYNGSKHHTGRQKEPDLELALVGTARLALTAELLNRSSGSRAAGDRWLKDWRHQQVGEHYRGLRSLP